MSSGLTPYQGQKRVFGAFRCHLCLKHWMSGNSWANCGQQCMSCKIMVYPYEQKPLEQSKGPTTDTDHPEALCEKCQRLGRSCRP